MGDVVEIVDTIINENTTGQTTAEAKPSWFTVNKDKVLSIVKKVLSHFMVIVAIVVSFGAGYAAHVIVVKTEPVDTKPKKSTTVSVALNEHKELIILQKTAVGYNVNMVMSDTLTSEIFNILSKQLYGSSTIH